MQETITNISEMFSLSFFMVFDQLACDVQIVIQI